MKGTLKCRLQEILSLIIEGEFILGYKKILLMFLFSIK